MSGVETALRVLMAVALVGGFATLSYVVAARLRISGVLARWGAVLICGMAMATLAFHVMMPLRLFRPLPAVVALALALVAALAPAAHRRLAAETVARDRRFLRALARRVARSPDRAWIFAWCALAVPVIVRPFLTPPVAWDFIMYHGTKAALWVQNGGAPALALDPGVPSWLLTRNHLAGGDVFIAWAMLPMSGELFVGLDSLAQWLGTGLMVMLLAREVGVRGRGVTLAAGFVLALSPFRLQVGSGYVELTLAITMGAALAYTLRYLRTGCVGSLLVALAALGLACAVKIIALPIAGIVLLAVAARALMSRQVRPLAGAVLLFVALGAPWYAYNIVDTGAPLSPSGVRVLGMPVGFTNDAYRHIHRLKRPEPYTWKAEWEAFSTTFGSIGNVKETAGWPVLVGFGVFILALPALARRRRWAALLLAAAFAANVAVVFSLRFSSWRLLAAENATRFWVTAMLIAVPVSALAFRVPLFGELYRRFLLLITVYNLARLTVAGLAPHELDESLLVATAAMFLLLAYRHVRHRFAPRARAAVVAVATLAAVQLAALHRDEHRLEAFKTSYFIRGLHRQWVDPAIALDDGAAHVIAVTHGITDFVDTGMFYYLMGSRLQNRLVHVAVTRDGTRPLDPLAETGGTDYATWLARLEAAKVDHVMSMYPATLELAWMDSHPDRFRRLYGSRGWGLYQLLPRGG